MFVKSTVSCGQRYGTILRRFDLPSLISCSPLLNLRLLQLGDSALPIGGYSQSWGLEAAIERGLVLDAPGLEQWTRSWLHHAVGPLEGTVVAAVARSRARASEANELLWASLVPPTLRHASRDLG